MRNLATFCVLLLVSLLTLAGCAAVETPSPTATSPRPAASPLPAQTATITALPTAEKTLRFIEFYSPM